MHPHDKNTMQRNLRRYVKRGAAHLPMHEVDALRSVVSFLQKPIGSKFEQFNYSETKETGTKKSDCFEVVSATGSGKTYMLGVMAKAMNVPTLILTPRNLLNRKTKRVFCNEMGIAESDVAVYDSRQPERERKRLLEGNPPPKFVVTSYQSLPSLIHHHELDFTNPDDVHYRPLVILDEVHEAQGPKTSKLIHELMKHVMVAGFTATDAGAASTLFEGQKPVYHLPLVEAVKRDIVCEGIQTGVLDVAIDKSWVAKFKDTPRGRDYKKSDVEAYARIPAVIEGAVQFHLTAEHPKLGILHRLPTVFFVEGVETAKEAAERYNKVAEQLGVSSRAAYVSGDMKDAALPILDQWEKGEIQAIFNDKLIGMGHDVKNATVAYSLKPSNLPYMVEQQMGRVTRKQGEDYVEKYGQNKLALAINVRGKGMNPYLFAQVLQSPDVYSERYMQTRKEHEHEDSMSKLRYHLPEGVEVHFEYDDMATVLSEANREREENENKAPTKPDDWLSPNNMQGIFIGGSDKLKQILRDYSDKLVAEKISAGSSDVDARAETDQLVGERTSGQGASSICASPEAIATLERQGKLQRKDQRLHKNKEANWLSFVELAREYLGNSAAIKAKLFNYADKKCTEFEISGMSETEARSLVYEEYIGLRTTTMGQAAICASPRAIAEMKAYGILRTHEPDIKPKEANWYSAGEKSRNGIASGKDVLERKLLQYAAAKRNSLIASGMSEPEALQIVDDKEVGYRLLNGARVLCAAPHVFESLVHQGQLKADDKKAPPLPTGWRSANQLAYDYKGGGSYFNKEFAVLRDQKIAEFTSNGVPLIEAERVVFEEWIGLRTVAHTETLCASPAALNILRQEAKLKPKGQTKKLDWEWLSEAGGRIVGGESALKMALTEYVALKREELLASGALLEEAETVIGTDVCEEIVSIRSGEKKLSVNPEIIMVLIDLGKIIPRKQKESGWLSTTEMPDTYSGKAAKFDTILRAYAAQKRESMAGATPEGTAKLVDAEYVGPRGTRDGLCASPKALSELEQAGIIVRHDKMPSPKGDWLSIENVGAVYAGGTAALRAKIMTAIDRKMEQTANTSRANWLENRTLDNGTPGECVNPALLRELENDGIIKRKPTLASKETFAARVGGKRDTAPGGDHLKRTGRARDNGES